jgi:hypothetical protein
MDVGRSQLLSTLEYAIPITLRGNPKTSPLLRYGKIHEENSIAQENPKLIQDAGKTHKSEQILLHGHPSICLKRVFK